MIAVLTGVLEEEGIFTTWLGDMSWKGSIEKSRKILMGKVSKQVEAGIVHRAKTANQ